MAGSKEIKTHVYVWGLNDKDQLGGPKGSKIKTPMLNDTLSAVNCVQIVGGSKSLFCGEPGAYCVLDFRICVYWFALCTCNFAPSIPCAGYKTEC